MKPQHKYLKWNLLLMALGFLLLYWIPVVNVIVVLTQLGLFIMQIIYQSDPNKRIQVKHD